MTKLSPNLGNVLIINVNSSKLIIDIYVSPYLVLLPILEFFPAQIAMLHYPMGLIQMLLNYKPTCSQSHVYFIILPIVSCNLVSIKIIIVIIIIIIIFLPSSSVFLSFFILDDLICECFKNTHV